MNLRIEPLTRFHNRKLFTCSDQTVDLFLREKAMQDQERELSRTNVLVHLDGDPKRILGYYTLTFTEIPQEPIPNDRPRIKRKVPVILLGQIGIDSEFQGRGYGDRLLVEAQFRVCEVSIVVGVRAIVLDVRTEGLAVWYERRGFYRSPGSTRMIKHINAVRRMFRQ